MMRLTQLIVAAGLAATATLSHAALTAYDSQAAFLSAVSSPGVDGFDKLSTVDFTNLPYAGQAGGFSYVATSTEFFGAGTPANPSLSTNQPTDSITFGGFSGGASAIGGLFYGTDVNGVLASGTVTLFATDISGATFTRTVTGTDTMAFIGLTSDTALASLVVSTAQPVDGPLWPTIDNLTLAVAAVPEPGTWLLMAIGLAGMAIMRRRTVSSGCIATAG